MKAEHRKELQTNALADRMGRFFQRMKARPRKKSVFLWFVVILVVVVAGGYLWVRSKKSSAHTTQRACPSAKEGRGTAAAGAGGLSSAMPRRAGTRRRPATPASW